MLRNLRNKPFLNTYAFIGAVLPDIPISIFFFIESIIRKTPDQELWGPLYFTESWQNFFDIAPIERVVFLIASIYLYRRLKPRLARCCLIIANVLFVASYLLFFLLHPR